MDYVADGNIQAAKEVTAQVILSNLDIKPSAVQQTLLQAIIGGSGKLTLEQTAAMDEATYSTPVAIKKSGNNYVLGVLSSTGDSSLGEVSTSLSDFTWILLKTITATASRMGIQVDAHIDSGSNYVGYTINSNSVPEIITFGNGDSSYPTLYKVVTISTNDVIRIWILSSSGHTTKIKNLYLLGDAPALTGFLKTGSLIKNVNIGLRYWGDICANLVAGSAGSSIAMKICNSTGTALHTNFVTIPSTEYARIPLERPIVLTATGGSQTVWNFTSLSNCDALINEMGILAKALLVELALDGINYAVLNEGIDFAEDISNILAPKITLVSGTGVTNGVSKLRVTYIVNIPLTNTTIKIQYQLNKVSDGDTSPAIMLLVGDATKYVSAGQVAII